MTYELAKQLKDAGFEKKNGAPIFIEDDVFPPTLSELIEACETWIDVYGYKDNWSASTETAMDNKNIHHGSTPEEAVARLWLALNKK